MSLREYLEYDSDTGLFTWIKKPNRNIPIGRKAGVIRPDGYIQIMFRRVAYFGHRLAWWFMYDVWPAEIDHINRDRTDNRIVNLRDVTRQVNNQNKVNFTGCWLDHGRWRTASTVNGKRIYIGIFDTKEEASEAYHSFNSKYQNGQPFGG